MKTKNAVKLGIILSITISSLVYAQGSSNAGNGGGSWVCRDKTPKQTVQWAELIDIWEGKNRPEFKFTFNEVENKEEVKKNLIERVSAINPILAEALNNHMSAIQAKMAEVSNMARISVSADASLPLFPDPRTCLNGEGSLEREGAALYRPDRSIYLSKEITQGMKPVHQVGLTFHEAAFEKFRISEARKYYSTEQYDPNLVVLSDEPREIVAVLLSENATKEKIQWAISILEKYYAAEISEIKLKLNQEEWKKISNDFKKLPVSVEVIYIHENNDPFVNRKRSRQLKIDKAIKLMQEYGFTQITDAKDAKYKVVIELDNGCGVSDMCSDYKEEARFMVKKLNGELLFNSEIRKSVWPFNAKVLQKRIIRKAISEI